MREDGPAPIPTIAPAAPAPSTSSITFLSRKSSATVAAETRTIAPSAESARHL